MGAPPHCEKVPLLKEDANVNQASVNPPPLTIGDISLSSFNWIKAPLFQAQAMIAQANWELISRPHQQVTTKASRLRYFTWMNYFTLYGSKVGEDTQEFTDEVSKILLAMGLTTSKKTEFATYQLKDVAQASYVLWRDNRPLRGGPLTWEMFKKAFLDTSFHKEMKEEKVVDFINLRHRGRSVHENSLEFIKLFKYAPSLVFDPRYQMSCFVMGVSENLQEKCHSAMLYENMIFSHLIVHARRV